MHLHKSSRSFLLAMLLSPAIFFSSCNNSTETQTEKQTTDTIKKMDTADVRPVKTPTVQ